MLNTINFETLESLIKYNVHKNYINMLVKGFEPVTSISPAARLEFYSRALYMYKDGKSPYICNCLYKVFSKECYYMEFEEVIPLFTEFAAFEPKIKTGVGGWWPKEDKAIRIDILNKCINQLETK